MMVVHMGMQLVVGVIEKRRNILSDFLVHCAEPKNESVVCRRD
jgi:hypothetical protein